MFAGPAQPRSHYERCRRFLKDYELPLAELARFIVAVLGVERGWTLALDRTNWKLGQCELNFLVLAIVHEGTAYPVIWFLLGKAGNSHTDERILLLELFLSLFDKTQVARLVAARERWLAWLTEEQIPLQTRGFNLEDTHVTHEDRLQKLFGLLALAFAWCHQVGLRFDQQRPRKKKKHGRRAQSAFRRGLDCLRRLFTLGTQSEPLRWQQVPGLLPDT